MPIHPDIAQLLEARARGDLSSMSVAEARAAHLAGATAGPAGPEMGEVTDVTLADVPVRIYRPRDGANGGTLVYFHGGGWVLGSIDTHDRQCRNLAAGSGATVVNVGYRLAPEHPFPAALDDALAVTEHVFTHSDELAVDPTRIVVGGDSAGGNLAAAVAIARRTSNGPALRGQLLVYPALDATMASASFSENGAGPFLSATDMAWFYDLYGNGHDATDWRLSPYHAAELDGLPPTLVITAELDPLRDEGEAYAHRLAEAGVSTAAVRYTGVCHGFFGWSHVAEPSRQAMAQAASWLSRRVAADH